MPDSPCAICDYPLPPAAEICPECGAAVVSRTEAGRRRTFARRLAIGYAVATTPSWCFLLILIAGWFVAHVILGITNPNGVQDGESAALDVLKSIALFLMLPAFLSALATPALLIVALLAHFRAPVAGSRRRWPTLAILLMLAAAGLMLLAMTRPFGGPPSALVDWIPD